MRLVGIKKNVYLLDLIQFENEQLFYIIFFISVSSKM